MALATGSPRLLQLFLALCFSSYLRVSQDTPLWSARSGADAAEALDAAPKGSSGTVSCQGAPCPTPPRPPGPLPARPWCSCCGHGHSTTPCLCPAARSCGRARPAAGRSAYPQADAVLVRHREVSYDPRKQLPTAPRPPGQRWVWDSMEWPSHCAQLKVPDGYFDLTMSYRRDSDILTPYGWREPWPGQPASTVVNVSAKTELVAWVVSNWREDSEAHVQVDVYGRCPQAAAGEGHGPAAVPAFENSLHPDYVTEKLWRNALEAWAVPVALGSSRSDYEQFLRPDAFIHVHDFQSAEELGRYLHGLLPLEGDAVASP